MGKQLQVLVLNRTLHVALMPAKHIKKTKIQIVSARLIGTLQGRIQDFLKGGSYDEGVGFAFADFISFFLNIPYK